MASGPQELRERVQPVFDAVGQRTLWVSDEAGAGTRLKLVTNAWLVAVAEGVAETIALAEGLGLDPALFLEAIEGGPLDSPYARMKAQAMIDRDFTPAFALKLATKDAMLAVESARERGLDLPVLEAISERMQQAVPEHGDEDLSATYLSSAPSASRCARNRGPPVPGTVIHRRWRALADDRRAARSPSARLAGAAAEPAAHAVHAAQLLHGLVDAAERGLLAVAEQLGLQACARARRRPGRRAARPRRGAS